MWQIPIFSGSSMPINHPDSFLTCGQFLTLIEEYGNSNNYSERQMKKLCHSKVSEKALSLVEVNLNKSWSELKDIMKQKFSLKLGIREKVELRKKLVHRDEESVEDFYQRCVQAQYLVSDDMKDITFDTEVLLNFLIGMSPEILDRLLKSECSKIEDFILVANDFLQANKATMLNVPKDPIQIDVEECFAIESQNQGEDSQESKLIKIPIGKNNSCDLCDEEFKTVQKLSNHYSSVHCSKDSSGIITCCFCQTQKRKSMTRMRFHILTVHFNSPVHKCKICNKAFNGPSDLERHVRIHHLGEKFYQCDMCNKTFTTISGLKNHSIVNHEEQKNLPCKQCDKTFQNEVALKGHVSGVHKVSEHVCQDCGKLLKSKHNYVQHRATVHGEKDRKKRQCSYEGCKYASFHKGHLDIHFKRVHLKEKNFVCDQCDKGFFNKNSLEEHKNGVHFNIKSHQCNLCHFASSYASKLIEHKNASHGTQKYDCTFCDYSSAYKNNVVKHIANVHNKAKKLNEN